MDAWSERRINIFANEIYSGSKKNRRRFSWPVVIGAAVIACGMVVSGFVLVLPPASFVPETMVEVPQGSGAHAIGKLLKEANVIRSPRLFSVLVSLFSSEKSLHAGEYLFKEPQSLMHVVRRMNQGLYGIPPLRVTFPEGISAAEMQDILEKNAPDFDSASFFKIAKPLEGSLFPDTYFIAKTTTPEGLVALMKSAFEKEYASLAPAAKRSQRDIIIMASILEREADGLEDAQVISGILWKRLDNRMPLQADATVAFGLGKIGSPLSLSDLQKDHPYNTYTRPGLPIGPIGNPGRDMLFAALNPKPSPYLYYLHAPDGKVYYGRTLEEHVANQYKYLR